MKTYLGMELGSTRIKAVAVDEVYRPVSSGDYTWQSKLEGGLWTYDLPEVWTGLKAALQGISHRERIAAVGVSGMMHGYLAFDKEWHLLTPFRTWQNTCTGPAAAELTEKLGFNIPQRWSAAHLYQAILNGEAHLSRLAHLTTLSGYVHLILTGENVLGVGEASGMFPIDPETCDYDAGMLAQFDALAAAHGFHTPLRQLLPDVLPAGAAAGRLLPGTPLEGLLPEDVPFAPPEGDAGTGMTATNAVAPRTGNVSAGTSIFAMVVLEKPLSAVYPEIDMVTTPTGRPVAMVHCNNCTADSNAWVSLLGEAAALFGGQADKGELYAGLYRKSLEGAPDCGSVTVCNYLSGEGVTHLDRGIPMVVRGPAGRLNLADFLRATLYSSLATLAIGMELLKREQVAIDSLTGHGGYFKTPEVGQRYLAAACGTAVTCMESAGEGGPYGMALLAAYLDRKQPGQTLEDYLSRFAFANAGKTVRQPDPADAAGFARYLDRYRRLLTAERAVLEVL